MTNSRRIAKSAALGVTDPFKVLVRNALGR